MNSFVDIPAMIAACRATCGTVALVGAGPGDPELLTLRAARLLAAGRRRGLRSARRRRRCWTWCGPEAERIYAGKERSQHAWRRRTSMRCSCAWRARAERRAPQGRRSLHLRPRRRGTPGAGRRRHAVRGGARHHRGRRRGQLCRHSAHAPRLRAVCLFVTGHLKDGSCDLDWPALARPRQTVVIYMGLGGLAGMCAQLVAHGLPAAWPAAVVAAGDTRDAARRRATLADLAAPWPRV